jgi:hypothetical protein
MLATLLPIARSSFSVSNGHYLYFRGKLAIDQREWKMGKYKLSGAVNALRPTLRVFADSGNCELNLRGKPGRHSLATLEIPLERGLVFQSRFCLKLNYLV